MPSPCEILHNRTFQCPGRPSQPVNMERVRNYLLSHKQAQGTLCNKVHWAHTLPELTPGQEVLFRSLVDSEYIPGTITDKANALHAVTTYRPKARGTIEQGNTCAVNPLLTLTPCTPSPTHTTPASGTQFPHSQTKPLVYTHSPNPTTRTFIAHLPCCIPDPPQAIASTPAIITSPSMKDVFWHLSTLNPLPSASVMPEKLGTPSAPQLALIPACHTRGAWKLKALPHNMTHLQSLTEPAPPALWTAQPQPHVIHAEIQAMHNPQWDSPKLLQWETPDQNA